MCARSRPASLVARWRGECPRSTRPGQDVPVDACRDVPSYVAGRVRRSHPAGCSVVPDSTAVVSFGSAARSRVATVGINPSRVEFLDRRGHDLVGRDRRLATLRSLGSGLPSERLTDAQVAQVVADCDAYFSRNPYRRWFDQLDLVLRAVGASYYDGSGCHLDLVQWATDPTWAGLDRSVQAALLRADVGFLQKQLKNESIAAQPARRTGGLPAAVDRVTLRTNDEAGDLGSQWHSAQQRHGLRRRVGPFRKQRCRRDSLGSPCTSSIVRFEGP